MLCECCVNIKERYMMHNVAVFTTAAILQCRCKKAFFLSLVLPSLFPCVIAICCFYCLLCAYGAQMKLIIGFIILAILGIIIGVAVAMSKANK